MGISFLLVALISNHVHGRQQEEILFDPVGLEPDRGYFAHLPFEHIDMVNGNLLLSFTDLVLPGNAGMDLRFVRAYNHQGPNGGWVWSFGIAGVPLVVEQPGPPASGTWTPTLRMADGTRHRLYGDQFDQFVVTPQFWRYDRISRRLELPNGWVATYETGSPSDDARLLEVQDQFGNSITPQWQSLPPGHPRRLQLASVTQRVGDASSPNRQRSVSFQYPDSTSEVPSSMTFDGRTWVYEFGSTLPGTSRRLLTSARPPVGPGWRYEYSTTNLMEGHLIVTHPSGGTVDYDFDDRVLPAGSSIHRSVVGRLTLGGRSITPATWTFTYQQSGSMSTGTAQGPFNHRVTFENRASGAPWWAPGTTWLLTSKTINDSWGERSRLDRTYTILPFTSEYSWEEVATENIAQNGRTYTTTYSYHGQSEHFGDYHRPWRIVESGDLTRTTTRTFDYNFGSRYLLDRVATETVNTGGSNFQISRQFDDFTGFLESETRYGITTHYTKNIRGGVASAMHLHGIEGHTTSYTFKWGAVENTTTPEYTITRSINVDGSVASETQRGHTITYSHDPNGRVTRVTPPLGYAKRIQYDNFGGEWIREERGEVGGQMSRTTTTVDGFGRVIETENSVGVRTTRRYDALGRLVFESLPFTTLEVGTSFSYDGFSGQHRVTERQTSDGFRTAYTHHNGVDITVTEYNGQDIRVTLQDRAAFGDPTDSADVRLVGLRDADGKQWAYSYNALGRLTRVDQPDGAQARVWEYLPGTDLLSVEEQPESGRTTFSYDSAGRLSYKENGLGRFTHFYDGNDRLIAVDNPVASRYTVHMAYDQSDNRTRVQNDYVTSNFTYDGANRLTARTDAITGQPSRSTSYAYGPLDNLEGITYPSGRQVVYEHDSENRVTGVFREPGRVPVTRVPSYHPSGAIAGLNHGNGVSETYTYDQHRYWPSTVGGGPISFHYQYDSVGNVVSLRDLMPGGTTQTFVYDKLDRLTLISGQWGDGFTYDALGNRRTRLAGGLTYAYNPASGRLLQISGQSIAPEVGVYAVDQLGNTFQDPIGAYSYTPFSMLERATINLAGGGQAVTEYYYDGDDQRRIRYQESGRDVFYHDAAGRLLSEFRYDAATQTTRWVRDYIYLGNRLVASIRDFEPAIRFQAPRSETNEGDTHGVTVVLDAEGLPNGRLVSAMNVPYTTVSGTAIASEDFTPVSGTITFPAGAQHGATQTIAIRTGRDVVTDDLEVFRVELGEPGRTVKHTVTIHDRPALPGDFNADGWPDLMWHNRSDGRLAIWYMNGLVKIGDDVLTPETVSDTNWHLVGAGDANRDGDTDLYWQHQETGQVWYWAMHGNVRDTDGVLQFASPISVDWKVRTVTDLNRDGYPDLIWQNTATGHLAVAHMGWGAGGAFVIPGAFDPLVPEQMVVPNWAIVGSGDFNRDENMDLLWFNAVTGNVMIWYMNARTLVSGVLTIPSGVTDLNWKLRGAADFDGNGSPDLVWQDVATRQQSVWLMDGGTRIREELFTPPDIGDASWVIMVAPARGGIAGGTPLPRLSIDPGAGTKAGAPLTFTLRLTATSPVPITVTYATQNGSALAGTDYVATTDTVTFNPGQETRSVSVETSAFAPGADKTVLLVLSNPTNAAIASSTGTGTIRNRRRGDLNGDGQPDLLWHHPDGRLEAWFMNGSTRIQSAAVSPVAGAAWEVAGMGDFNGDGFQDLVWQHPNGSLAAWLMANTTLMSSVPLSPSSVADTNWRIRGVGDLNQDGWPDLYWQHVGTGRLAAWTMNGVNEVSSVLLSPPDVADTNWRLAGVGDANADGSPDLWWQHGVTNALEGWFMNGATKLSGSLLTPATVPPGWSIAGSVDLNVAGTSDLLWQHQSTGQVAAWWMDGFVMLASSVMTPSQMTEAGWRLVGPK